jgi:pyrroline-5-carboxylate reductase
MTTLVADADTTASHSTAVSSRRVALIGAGTMGRAIAGGLQRAGVFPEAELRVVDRHAAAASALAAEIAGAEVRDAAHACADADVVLLCVKPKDVPEVLGALDAAGALAGRPLLISICAGVTIAQLEAATGGQVPVIRAMPNTAAQIGRGCTVVSRGTHATAEHETEATAIFSSVGRCLALDERHLDAVTAVSASGPAFIYVVLEALTDGAVSCGLPRAAAMELVARMTQGAAEMVLATGRHPAALKDDVTTPGGCTIAGLMVLEDGRARSVLARTIETTARVAAGLGR